MAEVGTQKNASYRAQVAQARTSEQLGSLLLSERNRLREVNQRNPQGVRSCRALTEATDLIIQRMLEVAMPEEATQREAVRPKIAVVATGGYGRRELCPFSDIDVTFVVSGEEDATLDATVRRMFLFLMETFSQRVGLKVGYGYRTNEDAANLDHQTQTALLDTRVIAGSHGLTQQFVQELLRHLWPAAFIRQKIAERRSLTEKHGATVYRIEPEVREGPGGLRDLHLAEWLATACFPTTRGDVWTQLQRLGAVSRRDVQRVTAAREFLLTVRNWTHWHTGRKAEVLVRERQELLAEALHYRDDDQASRVERFMEKYYEHTFNGETVARFVIERCLSERLSLSDELVCSGGEIHPAFPWVKVATPQFLVTLAQNYQEHGLVPGHDLRRMISEHLSSCPEIGTDIEAAEDFVGLLRAPAPPVPPRYGEPVPQSRPGVYDTLSLLADLGVLQRLIPELGVAYRRVPFDQIHRHTIGFHLLVAVRALESLRTTSDERLQGFRRIWAEVDSPEILFLACLLHDIGKVGPPGDHSESGAEIASDICKRLQLDPRQIERVANLIRHHLLLSDTAQLRDVTLDKTIQDFVQVVDSVDLLNMLLLLTYADMEATGVMTPVKIRFLEDLYYRAEPVLSGAAPQQALTPDRTRRFQSRLSRQLAGANLTPDQIREHTEGMPVSYLLNTRPEQIATHIRMVETLRQNGPVVEFDNEMGSDVTTLHICSPERPEPGLLSEIAGVLYAHEIAVYAAQVFTREGDPGIALDTLWADYHGRAIPAFKRLELEQDLVHVLKGDDVEQVIVQRRKQLPAAIPPTRLRFNNDVAESHTVIEIRASDQPGLLYRVTRAIAAMGWDIHSARITTQGDRARDAFYVTDREGGKLEGEEEALCEAFLVEFSR